MWIRRGHYKLQLIAALWVCPNGQRQKHLPQIQDIILCPDSLGCFVTLILCQEAIAYAQQVPTQFDFSCFCGDAVDWPVKVTTGEIDKLKLQINCKL